jgi:hypothetical protein
MRIVKILMILTFSLFVIFPMSLYAGQIGQGDFVSPSVFNFNGLGLPNDSTTPIVLGGNTYSTDDNDLRYYAYGANSCVDGECIGSNTDAGYIDIVFATPVLRAGGWVGISSGNVQFFNESDVLLGTVPVTAIYTSSIDFAGWQADTGLIKRIRINDTTLNNLIISFDNLTVEGGAPAATNVSGTIAYTGTGTGPISIAAFNGAGCGDGFVKQVWIPEPGPYTLDLSPGTYYICSCRDTNQNGTCPDSGEPASGYNGNPLIVPAGGGPITGIDISIQGPQPESVPTMTEWGMIIFIALAGLGSVYYLRRQRRA